MISQKKLKSNLKRLDKYLTYEKQLDATILIKRISPFNANVDYLVITIQNQFTGSLNWICRKIMSMDTQRVDIFGQTMQINRKIREEKYDNRMHSELAGLIKDNEKFVN